MRGPPPARSLTADEIRFFEDARASYETEYLAGTNPRAQSGFGRDEHDWERFRRPVVAPVTGDGTFLDIGCANGLLIESVVRWADEDGHHLEPYGVDLSPRLVALARQRLPRWRERVFAANALVWDPPRRCDYVRTELVYVPPGRRRDYVERLLATFVAPGGRLIVCAYGSSRLEGARAEHGFVITRIVSVEGRASSEVSS